MKKILSLMFLAILAITLFIISCKKDLGSQNTREDIITIASAKSWYNKNLISSSTATIVSPLWAEAEVKKNNAGENIVIVPASNGNTTSNPSFSMASSFLFSGNSAGIKQGLLVKIIGDVQYIKERAQSAFLDYSNRIVPDLNKGAIFVYDVNNRFKVGATIKNGVLDEDSGSDISASGVMNTNFILVNGFRIPSNNLTVGKLASIKPVTSLPSTFSTQGELNCTDWYWTTWNTGTGQIISEQYIETTCANSPTGTGTTTSSPANPPPPCPNSFHFVTKITADIGNLEYEGGWQVAAIDGLRLKLKGFGRPNQEVVMPRLYFGLPVLRHNGTNYTYEIAQSLATAAVGAAEIAALNAYKTGVSGDALNAVYRAALVSSMAAVAGTVSTGPGEGIVIPQKDISTANYPTLFWPLGC